LNSYGKEVGLLHETAPEEANKIFFPPRQEVRLIKLYFIGKIRIFATFIRLMFFWVLRLTIA